jgi:hypothetical protein
VDQREKRLLAFQNAVALGFDDFTFQLKGKPVKGWDPSTSSLHNAEVRGYSGQHDVSMMEQRKRKLIATRVFSVLL